MRALLTPVLSPEHGAYVVLISSLLVGIILGDTWTFTTSLAVIAALAAFQMQFPVMQTLRRRKVQPKLVLWAIIYGLIAAVAAVETLAAAPALRRIVWLAVGVFVIAVALGVARKYKSLPQELAVFAGLALASPWAEVATRGYMVRDTLGIWLLLVIAFWSAVFAVRVRSRGEGSRALAAAYLVAMPAASYGLVFASLITTRDIWLIAPSMARLVAVVVKPSWWERSKIRTIGFIESGFALATVTVAALLY